ncbi:MAG: M23 family metallopeptidase, partial [Candidatus Uhrbacteria bacterium]|nr:M23 family metallopeptidase [Candidatus Uhrbacteria bacterium]
MRTSLWTGTALVVASLSLALTAFAQAAVIRPIAFPTDPSLSFIDDYGMPRGSRTHEGVDILGPKMTPLYAAVDGHVSYLVDPEASWGYAVVLEDADGYTYHYLHVNNDTPGTNDGNGGIEHAYAPGIFRGATVTRGQLIGWMGDSGNAEGVTPHLHFEIRLNDVAINPFESLTAALDSASDYVKALRDASPDINTDKGLISSGVSDACPSGSLIKNETYSAVYYCGANGKRYAFPNERVYYTWYENFDDVITISDEALAAIPLAANVTYRPGTTMLKLESMSNVYLVENGGRLRWIQSPTLAAQMYGPEWKNNVHDLSDAFF